MMARSLDAPSDVAPSARYVIPSLDRALSILEYLATCPAPCGVSDIARTLKLSKNSVFRILVSLHARGYLERDEADKTYCLSGKLLTIGYTAIDEASLVEKSLDAMRRLRDATRETVLLGTLVDGRGMVLEQVASPEPVKFLVSVGHRFPLHTAAPGKAMLAFLPHDEQETILDAMTWTRFNDRTITDRDQFRRELAEVLAKGYAVDRGEQVEGLHCVAATVFDHRGRPLASLWVTGPSFRLLQDDFPRVAKLVMEKADMISRRFGYVRPQNAVANK
jgi:DNA-binding IclR family transcriptional regulator